MNAERDQRGRIAVGHPVDVASGEFFSVHTDFELDGLVPLTLERRYSTRSIEKPVLVAAKPKVIETPFGPGWSASWKWGLRQTLDGFTVVDGEGTEVHFSDSRTPERSFARSGRLLSPANGMDLVRVDAWRIRLVRYGLQREPVSHVFVWSQATSEFFLERIERTTDARIDVRYDERGRVVGLFQTVGQRLLRLDWELDWEDERVVQAVLVLPDGSEKLVARYVYDRGVLIEVQDRDGWCERYTYDSEIRLARIEYRSGSSHSMRYDGKNRCIYVTGTDRYEERKLHYQDAARTTYVTDSHGATTTYFYNERGQILRETSPLGSVTTYAFDDDGRPTVTMRPTGGETKTDYDVWGRTQQVTLPNGRTRLFTHDDQHRIIAYTDEAGARTEFEYDASHNILRSALPDGTAWTYRWTHFAQCAGVRNPLGHEKFWHFDNLGNAETESDWMGHVWRSTFNALGQCLTVTDPLGQVTHYGYDEHDDLFRVVGPDRRIWERRADPTGRQTDYIRPDGTRTKILYSSCGLPTEVIDREGRRTRYEWDTEPRRLLRIIDPSDTIYHIDYDAEGNVVRRRTFDGRTIVHRWERSLLVETVNSADESIQWRHDVMGRAVERRSGDEKTEYTYDDAGYLCKIADGSIVTEFKRDVFGNCTEEIQDGIVLRHEYDAVGNLIALIAPGYKDEIRYAFDPNGDCIGLARDEVRIGITRDALGREIERRLPGAAGAYRQVYDPIGRLLAQAHVASEKQTDTGISRDVEYDVSGALEVIRDSRRGSHTFYHDATHFLVGALSSDGSKQKYEYDPSGNRIRVMHGFRAGERDASPLDEHVPLGSQRERAEARVETAVIDGGRLRQLISHERIVRYGYDETGRTIRRTVQTGETEVVTRFTWNTKGQLTCATLPNGDVWSYRYDGVGRRIAKIAPDGTETRFVWDGYRIAYHREGTGQPVAWAFLPDDMCPVLRDDGEPQYVLPDSTGSPAETIGPDGKVRHVVQKGVWGEGFDGGPIMQPASGQWFDEETGLHYNVFRYYDPETARFLSPDPIGLAGGNNEYVGVPSPVRWRDPLGLAASCGEVALDANAVVGMFERGETAAVEAAMAGRRPVIPRQAAVEFLKGSPATRTPAHRRARYEQLKAWLATHNGRISNVPIPTGDDVEGTRMALGRLSTQQSRQLPGRTETRQISPKDAKVLIGAEREGVPLLSRDRQLQNAGQILGHPVEPY